MKCEYSESDVPVGRAIEAQLIAEAERYAASKHAAHVREIAAYWAAVRERLQKPRKVSKDR